MALGVACQEILEGMKANSEVRTVRGWKLFLVLPRMMLFRPGRGGPVSRKKLEARVRQFQEGALGMLTDPTRRPPVPRSALNQEVRDTEPVEPVTLDPLEFLTCLRKARRGAAAGAVRDDFRSPLPDA